MARVVSINERGTLTLPRESRKRLGLHHAGQVMIEDTPEGILLLPAATFPVEMYSEARLAEIDRGEASLAPHADALRQALANAPKAPAKPKPKRR